MENEIKNLWQFYTITKDVVDAMYAACEKATSSIDLEVFIFENDEEGERFTELLVRKATEGVKVRLLCDTAGSYYFSISSMPRRLKKAGVQLRFFNDIQPWRITRIPLWLNRNHRKLLVIDRAIAFTGGANIGAFMREWRDTHARFEGPIVQELQAAYDHMWWLSGRDKFLRFKAPRQTSDGFMVLTNAPRIGQRFIHSSIIEAIRQAKKYIYLTTPYFVPDHRFLRVLRLAARRGVEVKVLVPSASDHPYVDFASNFYFRPALKSGVEIYRYQAGIIHAKTVVIDGVWSSMGSANIDNLSSLWNYELNVVSFDTKFAEELKYHFVTDLMQAHEVTLAEWDRRGWWKRMFEAICAPFGKFF